MAFDHHRQATPWRPLLTAALLLMSALPMFCTGEHVRELEVSEGTSIGTVIGSIGDGTIGDSGPPYLIVPVPGSAVDSDLTIDQTTGDISTRVALDRETRSSYSFVAIPFSGADNVRVVVTVLDENDNAPTFPSKYMHIEFPENTPRDVKRTLHPARDSDLGMFNTQRYRIVSGNVGSAFRLAPHRERDGVLYLDLQVAGQLDRETRASYSLLVEALDGGTPPLRGEMVVNVTVQDVNDNQPVFNQSRYFAQVPENATVGTSVLKVAATDLDSGDNGVVEYSINRRQSDKDIMFKIDHETGTITVNKPLDFETKRLHELVVVARDHGDQPLETTAFVSIEVTDVNDNQPTINVIFLSDDATPKISESAQPGEFVARISVHDPDSRAECADVNVTLVGGDGHFGLTTRDDVIYLMVVARPLDREDKPAYTLKVVATDAGSPPLRASRTIHLRVTDVNDNAPEFEQEVYYADVMEVGDPGTSVVRVTARDRDEGANSVINYKLLDTPHSGWFKIDSRTGLVTTAAHVDCETEPSPRLVVVATDSGHPPLSATARIVVTVRDVNDNEPIFDQSFYNASVAEDEPKGTCIIKVSATDPDCGVNAIVNYTLGDRRPKEFEVQSDTGEVCIIAPLDYETRPLYEFPVIATDKGGLSTTAMIKIQLKDVNDNRPIFYPREYNVSLREPTSDTTDASTSNTPVVVVFATDADNGRYGTVIYKIVAGNSAGLFRIGSTTGEISVARPAMLSSRAAPYHRLNVSATDGAGLRAVEDAEVFVSVIDAAQAPPVFDKPWYNYTVRENVPRNTLVGAVRATSADTGGRRTGASVRYSIYSGDPDGRFQIDTVTGAIRTAAPLDRETHTTVLLNVQATSGEPPAYGHTQVNIALDDENDNDPEFESSTVRISVPENVEIGVPLYAAHANDADAGRNGKVRYRIAGGPNGLFAIDNELGHLTLARKLDYETAVRHNVVITASDLGEPSRSANLTVLVDVQDVNDNSPVFERTEYSIKVLESMPINSQILQVTAVDLDTGNNARLTYRLSNVTQSPSLTKNTVSISDMLGIFPNSGWIYLKDTLDRETHDRYELSIIATDNGAPSLSAAARVVVIVQDANDNEPVFGRESYEFTIEENMRRGAHVGTVSATDADAGMNAVVRYSLIPSNVSFQINPATGEIVTREPLDRELRASYDLVAEARDQGSPSQRHSRVAVRISVGDVNDNAPEIVDPRENGVSVREEQPPGTEVVRVRAVDKDSGDNATVTYSILKGRDSDGYGVFTIDPMSGVIRTKQALDHEEHAIYRLTVAATDGGKPPKQTIRVLNVDVLDLNDNRPTFSSSSLVFRIREDVPVGFMIGSVATTDSSDLDNIIQGSTGSLVTYTLTSLLSDKISGAFAMDRSTGSLVVARELDREVQSEFRLEVRALDTSAMNNPQSSAVTVRVDIDDVNDNAPHWMADPIVIPVAEDTPIGAQIYNFTATDIDAGSNGEIRYKLIRQYPNITGTFSLDPLTGTLTLTHSLDYEVLKEYTLVLSASDQSSNHSERLSTSVTARILVKDANDNAPKFVSPRFKTVLVSESVTVGMTLCHIVAVDNDSGENGRVTYVISGGNNEGNFTLNYDTGVLALAKPWSESSVKSGVLLNITASDHGVGVQKRTNLELKLIVKDSKHNPPRFVKNVYHANVSEDAHIGSFIVKVAAKSTLPDGGNLTYSIPLGIADDKFTVDPIRGTISTHGTLDRESHDQYTVPVYVTEHGGYGGEDGGTGEQLFDVTTLVVTITDINDYAPEFAVGACYPLAVLENSDPAVIHTVVAGDKDIGVNGDISYSIIGGNIGNKFSIDQRTGELTASSLDREERSRYWLTVQAQDHGVPTSLRGQCNISISVDDQNDNKPRFDQNQYSKTIPENIPADSLVLTVHATDLDLGVNGKIVYSLTNESDWLFRIDNKSGIITTVGQFDRERQSMYRFFVIARDSGKYNSLFQTAEVQITISDVNDNKPVFSEYPFIKHINAYTQPGQTLLRIRARDADEGTNAEILYSLPDDETNSQFRINPNTGILTTARSLNNQNGKIFRIQVLATDKGNPPQSTKGLIELHMGEASPDAPKLNFQNSPYNATLKENSPYGTYVAKVSAVKSDGRLQNIVYSIESGDDANIFDIDTYSGRITVKNPTLLDYEVYTAIKLIIEARTEGSFPIYGYCDVIVNLIDENDNSPRFTQQQYNAVIEEGKNKGIEVIRVKAIDADSSGNSRLLYHIVDGNHDNAFIIEPAFSGIVNTNIVLDREIRDVYRLTVIATDEGDSQMTGTSTIRINIIDINDNRPTFPPHSVINISEGIEVGTVLTSITANDVDTSPALIYSFSDSDSNDVKSFFTIDRYSGKIILQQKLDFEMQQEYGLTVMASDKIHTAQSTLTVKVTDVNDNTPIFEQPAYHATLPEGDTNANVELLAVNASDADSGSNAIVHYSLLTPVPGFTVFESTGLVVFNRSYVNSVEGTRDVQLVVRATDQGKPQLSAVAPVKVHFGSVGRLKSGDGKNMFRVQLPENSERGTVVIDIGTANGKDEDLQRQDFYIVDGDEDGLFEVNNPGGVVILIKPLDREAQSSYMLRLAHGDRRWSRHDVNSSTIVIYLNVEDVNDNAPKFERSEYEINVSEGVSIRSLVYTFNAIDADLPGSNNSKVVYDITSGNDLNLFKIGRETGELIVNNSLDYDTGTVRHALIIRACDESEFSLCSFATLIINTQDENDNAPHFPVSEYLEFVGENEPIGTEIFTAHATDLDKGKYGVINYTIVSSGYIDTDDSWKLFKVDSSTGLITTNSVFDYERQNRYMFVLRASDIGDKKADVKVRIEIESRDEFSPQFTERSYHFVLGTPTSGYLPVGYIVGHITATDRDKGPDGRVVYQLTKPDAYFKMNRTTGALIVKKKLDNADSALEVGRRIDLDVTASSGRQDSLKNTTTVEIVLDPLADPGTNFAIPSRGNNTAISIANGGLADWALGLLISLIIVIFAFGAVFLFLHIRNRRHKKINKPTLSSENVTNTNNYVDPSAFDTIPIRGGSSVVANASNQFAPPKYDEIPPYGAAHPASSNSGAATTSELSGSEQSGSSGRGSAEDDGEDEEIRMINEGPLQRDSGIHRQNDDGDNISDISVHNTQEYLARLGIVDSATNQNSSASRRCSETLGAGSSKDVLLHHQIPIDSLHMFDEEAAGESDITNLIYAKLNEVAGGSDHASSTDEAGAGISLGAAMDHVMMGGFGSEGSGGGTHHQPSMNGSLSSIVHSEEELTGSYNWDYLLDWGPQYQPLAHVFSEIARLKDDTASVQSATSGTSSVKSKSSVPPVAKNIPPPLLTNVAPRSIPVPILSSRGGSSHHSSLSHGQMLLLPRSPINHDATGTGFSTSAAMSPSFSPSLSPLATKSPSISPLVTPGLPTAHHVISLPRHPPQRSGKSSNAMDTELRI